MKNIVAITYVSIVHFLIRASNELDCVLNHCKFFTLLSIPNQLTLFSLLGLFLLLLRGFNLRERLGLVFTWVVVVGFRQGDFEWRLNSNREIWTI